MTLFPGCVSLLMETNLLYEAPPPPLEIDDGERALQDGFEMWENAIAAIVWLILFV